MEKKKSLNAISFIIVTIAITVLTVFCAMLIYGRGNVPFGFILYSLVVSAFSVKGVKAMLRR